MPAPDHHSRFHRRAFLQTTARLTGLLAAACAVSASTAAIPSRGRSAARPDYPDHITVGVLLPQSPRRSNMLAQLADGMRLWFDQAQDGPRATLAIEHYTSPHDSLARARRLVAESHVDVLTGLISRNAATALDPLLRAHGTPLIVSDIGANVIDQPQQSGMIIRNSLNYWQANLALGGWAASHQGKRAVIATSLYESGYDALYAFRYGFEQRGGSVADLQVTHLPARSGDLLPTMDAIRQARPDFVYAAYSGQEAIDFVTAYAGAGLSTQIPLLGSSFLTDEDLLPAQGRAAYGTITALPWAHDLTLAEHQAFAGAFRSATGRRADAIAALGYDTAGLVARASAARASAGALGRLLGGAEIAGPRGPLAIDVDEWQTTSPIYLREVRDTGATSYNAAIATLERSDGVNHHAAALRTQMRSGWTEAYLSI